MGGVILIVAVMLLLLLRRRKRNGVDHELNPEQSSPNIVEPFNAPPTAPVACQQYSPHGQSSSSSPVFSGSSRGGKAGFIPKRPSQSTIPTGPRPPRDRTSNYSSSQSSGSHANQNSAPGNSTSQLLGSNKAREAGELGDLPTTNVLSAQPEISVAQRVMRHEDSGLRLPARETMLELPPLYTAS